MNNIVNISVCGQDFDLGRLLFEGNTGTYFVSCNIPEVIAAKVLPSLQVIKGVYCAVTELKCNS